MQLLGYAHGITAYWRATSKALHCMIFPVHAYDIDIIAGCGVISGKRAKRPEAPPLIPSDISPDM